MNTETLYRRLPQWLQNLACSVEGLRIQRRRYGAEYAQIFGGVVARDQLPKRKLEELRTRRLSDHFRAAERCPFWRERFEAVSVACKTETPWVELEKLPIIGKANIQRQVEQILNPEYETRGLVACHTSGTTGAGLQFWETRAAERERWAVWWRYRQWHGIGRDTWCGYFGGRSIVPIKQRKPPFWRVNRPGRQIMFSAYHLRPETAATYISALEQFRPPWLHGYPSFITLIASFILERGRKLTYPVEIVTTGAENLLTQQRALIERAFGCPVRQHYGMAESVANFSECEKGKLHVDEDFSGVEFVPADDDETGLFRVVGTNWSNQAFPLFRYDTGDRARITDTLCSCGRVGRVVDSIDGRQEDYVVLVDGTRIGRLDHIFKDMVHVREAQIYQPSKERVIIRIVKSDEFTERESMELLNEARKRLGRDIDLRVEYMKSIPRSNSGKLRFVVSDVV